MLVMLAAPALSLSTGPPGDQSGKLTAQVGCTCHSGEPSAEVLISISGVPESYGVSTSYNFTITAQAKGSDSAGFLLTDYSAGEFSWAEEEEIKFTTDANGTISHSAPAADSSWVVVWTAPAEDSGIAHFALVANAVDGDGVPGAGDKWNILSFSIDAPGGATAQEGEALATRTISKGDYDALFAEVDDAEAIKKAEQETLAERFFTQGNLYYWPTLGILLIGALVQREFYERRFGGGPPHLAAELAIPQGVRLGVTMLVLLYLAIYGYEAWGHTEGILVGCLAAWAAYGLYRTWVQARAPAEQLDML